MEYKAIEKPPTPPESPAASPAPTTMQPFELSLGLAMEGLDEGSSSALGRAARSTFRPPSPTLTAASTSTSRRPSFVAPPLNIDTVIAGPSAFTDSSVQEESPQVAATAYSKPETLPEQLGQHSRSIYQRGRVLLGLANQTIINVLPATPTALTHGPGLRQNNTSPQPGRRQLTSRLDKQKGRAEDGEDSRPPPAWRNLLRALSSVVPSGTGGPKRIRTRARRFLILLAALALLLYTFSSTLRQAYSSAAVERRLHYLEELERERLGKHLSEYERHPIQDLLDNAKKEWEDKVARQSQMPEEAITEYKRRYKRDPPNGFAEWFLYAKGKLKLSLPRSRLISTAYHREGNGTGGRVRLVDGIVGAILGARCSGATRTDCACWLAAIVRARPR